MDKATTYRKPKTSPKKSTVKLKDWSPTRDLIENPDVVRAALSQAIAVGDRDAFVEIIQGCIAALLSVMPMEELVRKTKVSRRTLYALLKDGANPTTETVFSVMKAFKGAA